MLMKSWLSHKVYFLAALALVFVCTLWAYWPTLSHAPKHDQVAYLANAATKTGLYSLTLGSYDLNRQSNIDLHLFRPLLYIFLGFEFWLFQYYFALWHMTGILLHLLVAWALFVVLSKFRQGWPAVGGAAFFALMLTNVPMVNWEHINAYMLFCLLVLLSLKELFFYIESEGQEKRRGVVAAAFLVCAAFIFEAGALFSLVLALSFFIGSFRKTAWRWAAGLFMIPFVLYLFASALDLVFSHRSLSLEAGKMVQAVISFQTILYYVQTVKWFMMAGLFARVADTSETVRTVLLPSTFSWQWPFNTWTVDMVGGLALLGMGATALMSSLSRAFLKKRGAMLLCISGLLTSYVLLLVIGRVNTRGADVGLLFNTYYFYIFWMLFIILLFAGIDWDKLAATVVFRILRWPGVILLTGIILMNAFSIRHINARVAFDSRAVRGLIEKVSAFVLIHKVEPDFSFYMAPGSCPGDEIGQWFQNRGLPVGSHYTLPQVLYPKYFREQHPKYIISCLTR